MKRLEDITLVPLFSSEQLNVGALNYIIFIAAVAVHKRVMKQFENRKLQANGQSRNWAGLQ